jgi:hypothetical protein
MTMPLSSPAAAVSALAALAACGGGTTQVFTRQVPATPAAIVGSAVTTFSNLGIPVAVADEPDGKVQTAPVDLRAGLASGSPGDRVACPARGGGATSAPDAIPVAVTFEVKVKPVPDGSIISLDVKRENDRSRCVVKSSFVAQLLDTITQGARHQ